MVNIEKLQAEEMEQIENNTNDDELYDLETLILEGAGAKIPIKFEYPVPDLENNTIKYHTVSAQLKPLTNIEASNAKRLGMKNPNTTIEVELLKKGLYNKNGELMPAKVIEKMKEGVVEELCKKLLELSGIRITQEEQIQMAKEIMGF